jgi:DNA (cytosine-5)-methyltransferase 1
MTPFVAKSIELFVGAGGLALGTARAGFEHIAVFDWNENACRTLRQNKINNVPYVKDWDIVECDIRKYDFKPHAQEIEVVFGGPPCQPFSVGGKHLGHKDERNMFPEAIRAIRDIQPKAFIFENVKGLLRANFSDYYNYVIHQLRFPEIEIGLNEKWEDHFSRLKKAYVKSKNTELSYNVIYECKNAADFGIPQKRERVFVVGTRTDLGIEYSFPEGVHTQNALLYDKWITGEYWERHEIPKSKRPNKPIKLKRRIDELLVFGKEKNELPWRTVRDAIGDLPKIKTGETSSKITNHFFNSGAKSYHGHDGSQWDEPAKTIKAGHHGVPGGENTLRLEDGSIRYFSVRECARLQTFPDEWVFETSWTEAMRQLGNAVPVDFATEISSKLSK